MLDVTLSTSFVPGANVRGAATGASWIFLRPAVPAGQVICLGTPAPPALATLVRFSDGLLLLATGRQLPAVPHPAGRESASHVRSCRAGALAAMPVADQSVDLLVLTGWRSLWRLRRDRTLREGLRRRLKRDALVYYEYLGGFDLLRNFELHPAGRACEAQRFLLTPLGGELHAAVPARDRDMATYFRGTGLSNGSLMADVLRSLAAHAASWVRPAYQRGQESIDGPARAPLPLPGSQCGRVRTAARRLAVRAIVRARERPSALERLVKRHGVLVGAAAGAQPAAPPEYLRTIAATSGIQLDGFRWGLSARGEYSSRKLVFYLTEGSAPLPRYVAKMVRDPIFNPRLENEYRALSLLSRDGAVGRDTVPQPVFFGHHANLAIVGETVVHGSPFSRHTTGTADCPSLHSALEWFTTLAVGTGRRPLAPGEAAGTLECLLARFHELYRTTSDEQRFLNRQIAAIGTSGVPLPLTFQHGDPGTWNMLVTPGGGVALLDWEAAEPQGMPLWDLFYFLRSYVVGAARLGGGRGSLEGLAGELLRDTPLSRMVADATQRYCRRTDLSESLIEPLFYGCWLHRALKEATRLTPSRLGTGYYVNLLRLLIARHRTPALRRLFGQ